MNRQLVWKLGDFLRSRNISAYALGKRLEAGRPLGARNVAENLAYRWVKATDPPERLHTEALEEVLAALEELTGEPVALTDVLAYEEAPEPAAAPTLAGAAERTDYAALIAGARPLSWAELTASTGEFTPEEREADDAYWLESRERDLEGSRVRQERLSRLWDELDAAEGGGR